MSLNIIFKLITFEHFLSVLHLYKAGNFYMLEILFPKCHFFFLGFSEGRRWSLCTFLRKRTWEIKALRTYTDENVFISSLPGCRVYGLKLFELKESSIDFEISLLIGKSNAIVTTKFFWVIIYLSSNRKKEVWWTLGWVFCHLFGWMPFDLWKSIILWHSVMENYFLL